ncbi:MAG: DUF1573 domain-containing protein [Bacteroidia bacterium]|nr:DUF1573 domain-containing protein [Bacteroidia bacterium]
MKKAVQFYTTFILCILATSILAQNKGDKPLIEPKASVTFKDTIIEFGVITQKDSLVQAVEFKNTGKVPFHFYDAVSECGCATIVVPKTDFKPGKKGTILIIFKSPYMGSIEKKITLVSNAGIHYLVYRAYVKE